MRLQVKETKSLCFLGRIVVKDHRMLNKVLESLKKSLEPFLTRKLKNFPWFLQKRNCFSSTEIDLKANYILSRMAFLIKQNNKYFAEIQHTVACIQYIFIAVNLNSNLKLIGI